MSYPEDFENMRIFGDNTYSFSSYKDDNSVSPKEDYFGLEHYYQWGEEKLNSYYQAEEELNIRKINPIKNINDIFEQKIINEDKNENNQKPTSTDITSDKKEECKINKKIGEDKFKTERNNLPDYWRMDSTKKHWKTHISNYAKEIINILIKESDLPKDLKKTIHSPNSLKFTSNITVSANIKFLNFNLVEVFTIGKEKCCLQEKNYENISKIFEYFLKLGDHNLSDSLRKIKEFFEMSYEDLIRKFYDSDEFIDFKNDDHTKFFDDVFLKQEKFSLLKDYGLINLFKMIKKKRKRE